MNRRKSRRSRDPFTLLPAKAVVELDPAARIILLGLASRYRGHGNGTLGYGMRDAAQVSKDTGSALLAEMEDKGYIAATRDGSFMSHLNTEWRLLWFDATGHVKPGWGRMLKLPRWVLDSPAWRAANVADRAVYLELLRRYTDNNNGRIEFGLPNREEGRRIGLARSTIARAIRWLIAAGFIVETTPRGNGPKAKSRLWRLTMYPAKGREATKDFMKRPPPPHPAKGQKTCPGPRSGTDSASVVLVAAPTPETLDSALAAEIAKTTCEANGLGPKNREIIGAATGTKEAESVPLQGHI
jgi:DNA-binding MarR family transcriptional regulator